MAELQSTSHIWLIVHRVPVRLAWAATVMSEEGDPFMQDGPLYFAIALVTLATIGITYRDDHPRVVESIRALIARGEYPRNLWT